jgi:hypothetical protein
MEGAAHHTVLLEQYFVTNKIPLESINVNKTHQPEEGKSRYKTIP